MEISRCTASACTTSAVFLRLLPLGDQQTTYQVYKLTVSISRRLKRTQVVSFRTLLPQKEPYKTQSCIVLVRLTDLSTFPSELSSLFKPSNPRFSASLRDRSRRQQTLQTLPCSIASTNGQFLFELLAKALPLLCSILSLFQWYLELFRPFLPLFF